jgi:hypothetical protein
MSTYILPTRIYDHTDTYINGIHVIKYSHKDMHNNRRHYW